jgi:hypothetical protein
MNILNFSRYLFGRTMYLPVIFFHLSLKLVQDFGKPNMTNTHTEYLPSLEGLYYLEDKDGYQFYATLSMPTQATSENGAPQTVIIRIFVRIFFYILLTSRRHFHPQQ